MGPKIETLTKSKLLPKETRHLKDALREGLNKGGRQNEKSKGGL